MQGNASGAKELYGAELVRTPYWKLLHKAFKAYTDGRERQAADMFIECLDLAPTKWANERYSAFLVYGHCVCTEADKNTTGKDIDILDTKFVQNTQEPLLFRFKAALDICFLKVKGKDLEGGDAVFQTATDFSNMTDPDASKWIMALRPDALGKSVRCVVKDLWQDLDETLNALSG